MELKKTLVIGASENTDRYSNKAIHRLREKGHPVLAIGSKVGKVVDVAIITDHPDWKDIHTVTLYLNPKIQQPYYDYIIGLKPKRLIFNPGAENVALEQLALAHGIEPINACTLVMLSIGNY